MFRGITLSSPQLPFWKAALPPHLVHIETLLKEYLLAFEIWFPFPALFDLQLDPEKMVFSVSVSAWVALGPAVVG